MSITLRDYQQDIIVRARASLRKHKSVVLQAPTGAGKTALSAFMTKSANDKGLNVAFVCHRKELIKQTSETYHAAGVDHGFVASGMSFNPHQPVHVCGIGTLKHRLEKVPLPGLVIWDECHHIAAAGWRKVREHWSSARHIGLSATPERTDGNGLADLFEDLVPGPSPGWLIEQGYLSQYRAYAPAAPDLQGVKTTGGDFNRGQLSEVMDGSTIIGDAVRHYKRHAMGKRAVAFCVSIEHSERVAAQFRAAGIVAISLDGTKDPRERELALEAFRRGEIQVLCNIDLFGEGFDLPQIEAVILLRPTHSLGLFLQQVGRVLRVVYAHGFDLSTKAGRLMAIAAGPKSGGAIILDHAGNIARHGLPDDDRDWSLEGKKARAGQTAEREESVSVCPDCYATHRPSPKCPECGHVYISEGRKIKEEEGELEEIDPKEIRRQRALEQFQADTLEALVELGISRGYRSPQKWAAKVWTGRQVKAQGKAA